MTAGLAARSMTEKFKPPHTLRCMEIWGGSGKFENALSLPGMDVWVYSRPYAGAEHGGDIHYISTCGSGRVTRYVVADVSGHGQQAGEFSNRLRGFMRKYINQLDQRQFARFLNEEISTWARGGIFATAVLTSYFAPTDHLLVSNAGHPAPLWYHARERRWEKLCPEIGQTSGELKTRSWTYGNLPLGVIESTEFSQFAVRIEKDDLVLLYTDSLIEAANSASLQLGERGLLALVGSLDGTEPDKFINRLIGVISDYRSGAPSEDDMTILLLHHNAAPHPRQSIGEMARVFGKMLNVVKV